MWHNADKALLVIDLIRSQAVWIFDVWHMILHIIDNMGNFILNGHLLAFWHFLLKPPQPCTWLFLLWFAKVFSHPTYLFSIMYYLEYLVWSCLRVTKISVKNFWGLELIKVLLIYFFSFSRFHSWQQFYRYLLLCISTAEA